MREITKPSACHELTDEEVKVVESGDLNLEQKNKSCTGVI